MLCYVASVDTTRGGEVPIGFDRIAFLGLFIRDVENLLQELNDNESNASRLERTLHDKNAMQSLESFLAGAPRPFDKDSYLEHDGECAKLEGRLRNLVLKVLQYLFVDAMLTYSWSTLQAAYKPLLTVVCLLDIASIYYSQDSIDVCTKIVSNMTKLGRPWLQDNFQRASSDIAENLSIVSMVIIDGVLDGQNDRAFKEICDGVEYLRDACFSLCAALGVNEELRYLSLKDGFHLVESLDLIHDTLIPKLYFFLENIPIKSRDKSLISSCCELECAAGKSVDLLFDGLLKHREEDEGMAGGSSGISECSILRGETLIDSLCRLNGREDAETRIGDGLLRKMTHIWDFAHRIQQAIDNGIVFLDDAQKQYVLGILGLTSFEKVEARLSNEQQQVDDPTMAILTRVSQVEEILPGAYGAGFIALCLHELDDSPENVIDALLSGNIPKRVEQFATDMDWKAYTELKASHTKDDAGPKRDEYPALHQKKSKGHSTTTKFLDTVESSYKDRLRNTVVAMQWEYDDEYDDSYDEVLKVAGESGQSTEVLTLPKDSGGPQSTKKPKKIWVLDGRVYNYPKEGATECSSQDEVDKILAEQELSKLEIHGLGPGGNKSIPTEVTGKPEKKSNNRTSKNYSFKEKNKGRIGNHNRKDRATSKQAKGM